MARHVIRNFAPNLVPILDGSVSNFSISILDHAFWRRGSFYPDGRIERNSGLQPSVYQADYFHVQRSVSFLIAKYDLQNKQIAGIAGSSYLRFEIENCENITFSINKFLKFCFESE